MTDYTWSSHDRSQLSAPIPHNAIPARFALTYAAVVLRAIPVPALLVCNLHPDTWNNWLLPYGSITGIPAVAKRQLSSFYDLSKLLSEMQDSRRHDLQRLLSEQILARLGRKQVDFDDAPSFENYSLKYSESARCWTGYAFGYVVGIFRGRAELKIEHEWIPLKEDSMRVVLESRSFAGRALASNVTAVLQEMPLRERIKEANRSV